MGEEINSATFCSSSEEATLSLGRKLGAALTPGVTVLLSGDLGAGKTVLVRGVGDALRLERVRSPSFTLINEYKCEKFTVIHVDLYRLADADDLGLDEYLDDDTVLLVEWPDRWQNPPSYDTIKISFEMTEDEPGKRLIYFSAKGAMASDAVDFLKERAKP